MYTIVLSPTTTLMQVSDIKMVICVKRVENLSDATENYILTAMVDCSSVLSSANTYDVLGLKRLV